MELAVILVLSYLITGVALTSYDFAALVVIINLS